MWPVWCKFLVTGFPALHVQSRGELQNHVRDTDRPVVTSYWGAGRHFSHWGPAPFSSGFIDNFFFSNSVFVVIVALRGFQTYIKASFLTCIHSTVLYLILQDIKTRWLPNQDIVSKEDRISNYTRVIGVNQDVWSPWLKPKTQLTKLGSLCSAGRLQFSFWLEPPAISLATRSRLLNGCLMFYLTFLSACSVRAFRSSSLLHWWNNLS